MSLELVRAPTRLYRRFVRAAMICTMLIFSMGMRMLPVFEGTPMRGAECVSAGLVLIGVGLLVRELQVVAFLSRWPELLRVSGLSGLVAAAGVCLCGGALLATLRPRTDPAQSARRHLPIVG